MANAGSGKVTVVTYTLKIWYRFKHDDYTVAEVYHQPNPVPQVKEMVEQGGFWYGVFFIPYHSISTIEVIEERPNSDG